MVGTPRGFGALRWRLLAAFLTVAVGAVALLAAVAALAVDERTADLAAGQRSQLRAQVAQALAAAYTAGRGSWAADALGGVRAIASAHDMGIVVVDRSGNEVAGYAPDHGGWELPSHPEATDEGDGAAHDSAEPGSSHTPEHEAPVPGVEHDETSGEEDSPSGHALGTPALVAAQPVALVVAADSADPSGTESVTVPIVVEGEQIGSARLTLPAGLDPALAAAREALLRNVGVGAALAVVLAGVAAGFVARRMSAPVTALTAATRAFADGDPDADRLVRPGPGELGDLGVAFTAMAGKVRRQDELRRSMVADVAHELRTPVTVLRAQTEALLDGVARPSADTLVSLHDEVLRLERLTDDLATLSAADAAGLSLHTERVDLGAVARRAVESMTVGFDDAELTVRIEVEDDVCVDGDDTRLTQVVTNLLTNAAKFTPPGGTVTLCVTRDGPSAVLTVSDTGPGIAAEDLRHVFDRFWRGGSAVGHPGTGIGLAVVDALVSAHGGTVVAGVAPGGGACFTVRLRATTSDASGPARTRGRNLTRRPPGPTRRVGAEAGS